MRRPLAVQRQSLADSVFEQLRDQILTRELKPGDRLPSERDLCELFAVNRASVREAIKRLEQLHMVAVRQGEKTRVLDFREECGLEVLSSLLFDAKGSVRPDVVRDLVDMRSALGPDVARLAALRCGDDERASLETAHKRMVAAKERGAVELQRAHFDLWRQLVRTANNIAYEFAFNTLDRTWAGVQELVAPFLMDEIGDIKGYKLLVGHVASGNSERARAQAARLVEKGAAALHKAIDVLEQGSRTA